MAERQDAALTAFGGQLGFLVNHLQSPPGPPDPGLPRQPAPPAPAGPPTTPPADRRAFLELQKPQSFSGDSGDCRSFLVQCGMHFEFQAASFPTDRSKVAYILSHLTGRAEAWATAEWSRQAAICDSVDLFTDALVKIFQHTAPGREAARGLVSIRQGQRRAADYAVEFRTLAAESGWNQAALFDAFLHGLSEPLKDQFAPLELPADLESVIALAIRVDQRLWERERSRGSSSASVQRQQPAADRVFFRRPASPPSRPTAATAPPSVPAEPMQVGSTRLSPEERWRRIREGRCIYCAQLGHVIAKCPVKGQAHQ